MQPTGLFVTYTMEVCAVNEQQDQSSKTEEEEFDANETSQDDENVSQEPELADTESEPVTEESVTPSEQEDVTSEQKSSEEEEAEPEEESLFLDPDDDSAESFVQEEDEKDGEQEEGQPQEAPNPLAARVAQLEQLLEEQGNKLVAVEKERDDTKSRLLRTAADLDNMRKRREREQAEQQKYGAKRLVLDLLPAVDNLGRALEHAQGAEEVDAGIVDGVQMVNRQIETVLEKHSIKNFDSLGETFDPQRHEAMQQVETPDHETGEIIQEFQKGYFIHDRLLRPAWVVVAKKIEPEGSQEEPEEDASGAPEVIDVVTSEELPEIQDAQDDDTVVDVDVDGDEPSA